jgi:hypothetical protein
MPQFVKEMDKGEKKLKPTIKSSLIYTNPNRKNKAKSVVWTSLGPLPRWVPGPTTRWAPETTRLVPHDT